jgi:hypothetical protein
VDGRTDGWTDEYEDMTKLIGAFRSTANAPKNGRLGKIYDNNIE